MELWKIHKFCQETSLEELLAVKEELSQKLLEGKLEGTNAHQAIGIVNHYIDDKTVDAVFSKRTTT